MDENLTIKQESNVHSRFKKKVNLGVVVAIRAAESFDRYTVLKQGDYTNARYGTQYDVGVFSPFMDLSTEDLWRITSLLNLDCNEIYSMYWDAGVPLAKQRIGSPVNEKSGDSVKLYKVLNPGTYSKMVGRIAGVDFVAAYGGCFNQGFKYIKLDQPKPFYEGILTSDSLIKALNYVGVDYTVRDITKKYDDKSTAEIFNTLANPVKNGMNIRLTKIQNEFIREQASLKAIDAGDEELAEYFSNHIPKEKTWYDYCVELVNNAEPMYKNNWMPKLVHSMKHWATRGSGVNETSVICMRIMSNRHNKRYGFDKLDYQEHVHWDVRGYEDLSRKPIMRLFRYNMDCAENLVREYIENMVDDWDNGGKEEFEANTYLHDIIMKGNIIPCVSEPAIELKIQPSGKEIRQCVLDGVEYIVGREKSGITAENATDENIKECLLNFASRFAHDNVRDGGGSWKRATIMCLRNDIKGTYMGFSQSSEERAIRLQAESAFAETEVERKKKLDEFNKLRDKMAKEKAAAETN